ncbi:MAG: hypothetical protein LBJ20_03190 [Candidatus Methanoplasma sp.]|nr:hypothetical protein [Candidatus Methanoplasma sp.]
MFLILFLILFPVFAAIIMLFMKSERQRSAAVTASVAVIMAVSVLLVIRYGGRGLVLFELGSDIISYSILLAEILLAAGLFCMGVRHKRYLASVLAVIQAVLVLSFEFGIGHGIHAANNLYIDGLSSIMVLIIGIAGSLIIIYAIGYMRDFQHHNPEKEDRRPQFFFLMFVFLSAMFGIVLSNNLTWMLFFWEVTTVCSFLLIGYTKTDEAVNSSFRALTMNLLGGIGFAFAIIIAGNDLGIAEMNRFLDAGLSGASVMLPAGLLVFAGMVKAAQMPFHSWLLGAMVAPTPISALLHSSTMVKAGVFMVIKLSPILGLNSAGMLAMLVGGTTFLLASMAAVSQSNAKRVLAYSTIANLGLIIACAGVGTEEAVWAAIMLTIFHAVTKSLLFLCVGTAEHHIGSRDIEDMDGLFSRMPKLAGMMIIGIAGMFLAPFGMLVAKWTAIASFVNAESIVLIVCVCFGSAVTVFYWGKWLGKMVAVMAGRENTEMTVHRQEWFAIGTFAHLVVALCILFPIMSEHILAPLIGNMFGSVSYMALPSANLYIMSAVMMLMILLPLVFFRGKKVRTGQIYMGGVGTGDNLTFIGSADTEVNISFRNWYMKEWFGEKRAGNTGAVIAASVTVCLLTCSLLVWGGIV